MAEADVGLRLALKNRHETVAGLDDVGDELNRVGDQADRAGRKARFGASGMVAFGRAGKLAGRAAVYGVGAATAGVVGAGIVLAKLSKDSIAEAREAQKVGAVTRREIRNQGREATITARQVGKLTSAISKKVGIDDEEIQTGANILLTFHKVHDEMGRGNAIYKRAVQDATDLSVQFGSVESGSKMLGKALQDPVKGITALARAGVTFSAGQIERIKRLVNENKLLGAQKMILHEVEGQVGGVAAAQATWGDKARVTFGNIEEQLGTALLPLLDDVERWFVQKGGPALDHWVGIFEKRGVPKIREFADVFERKVVPAIGDFVHDAKPLAKSILPAIGTGLETAADAFKIIAPRAKAVFDGFNDLPDWAKSAIAITAGAGLLAKKVGVGSLFGSGASSGLLGAVSKAKPLPVWVVNGGGLPGGPGGKAGKFGKLAPFSAIGASGAEIAGGVVLFTAGAAALAYLQHEQRGDNANWMTSPGHSGIRPSGGTFHPDAYGQQIQAGLITGKAAGDKVGAAAAQKDWLRVIQLVRQYRGSLDDSTYAQGVLSTTSQAFARKFGVSLGDLDRILGGRIPKSMDQVKAAIGRGESEQRQFTRSILGGKAAADELTRQLGIIGKDWHARITLDGVGTAEARLASFQSKLAQLNNAGVPMPAPPSAPAPSSGGGSRGRVGTRGRVTTLPGVRGPQVNGYSRINMPDMPKISEDDFGGGGGGPLVIVVQSVLDGKLIAESTVEHIRGKVARS